MDDPLRPQGGFADLVGYRLAGWREAEAELTLAVEARHLNRGGVLHGGVLTTLIDTACSYAGCYTPEGATPRRAFTLSLTCQFIASVEAGAVLTARAERSGGGRQVFFARCDVRDQDGRLIGQGDGVHRYRSTDSVT
ncbi:MAG: PaaI family thioesterase [Rhodospirillales bacterium]|nr:PaaI family thioesterase [Rhodospirillales bacterium]